MNQENKEVKSITDILDILNHNQKYNNNTPLLFCTQQISEERW